MTISDNIIYDQKDNNISDRLTPWFSAVTKENIRKAENNQLLNDQYVQLFKEIAQTSIKFYSPKTGQYIAIQLADGKIVATDDTKYNLLAKIQEKDYPSQIFIWKVPSPLQVIYLTKKAKIIVTKKRIPQRQTVCFCNWKNKPSLKTTPILQY